MGYKRVQIANCHLACIRKAPWNTEEELDIVGYKKGPRHNSTINRSGEFIDIDPTDVCYDWQGRKFYKVRSPEGWIYEGVIDFGGDVNGRVDSGND